MVNQELALGTALTWFGLALVANSLTGRRENHRIRDIEFQVVGSRENQFNEEEACP
jgi:hypothetical protein